MTSPKIAARGLPQPVFEGDLPLLGFPRAFGEGANPGGDSGRTELHFYAVGTDRCSCVILK